MGGGTSEESHTVSYLSPRARRLLDSTRVARLATVSPQGDPYPVPICFVAVEHPAKDGSEGSPLMHVYSVVDEKPKRTRNLKRVRNISDTSRAALIVDQYHDDWAQLGWVQLRGEATLVIDPNERTLALEQLRARYPQYNDMNLEAAPLLCLHVTHAAEWWATSE